MKFDECKRSQINTKNMNSFLTSRSATCLRVPASSLSRSSISSKPSIILSRAHRTISQPACHASLTINATSSSTPSAHPSETPTTTTLQTFTRLAQAAVRPAAICCLAAAAFAILSPSALAAAKSAKAVAATEAASGSVASLAKSALDFILHLDVHLGEIITQFGSTTYAILFAIVFAETGLVVTPFLPGDSLLFATGALAALGKLNIMALMAVYITAATLGDAVNYAIGNFFGARAVDSKLIRKEYIAKTEKFYTEYGGKTVVLARFVPIVRTFAPFVAGVGSMP
jgi:membrane-associated protein